MGNERHQSGKEQAARHAKADNKHDKPAAICDVSLDLLYELLFLDVCHRIICPISDCK